MSQCGTEQKEEALRTCLMIIFKVSQGSFTTPKRADAEGAEDHRPRAAAGGSGLGPVESFSHLLTQQMKGHVPVPWNVR